MGRRAEEPTTQAGRAIWKPLERIISRGHDRGRVFSDWLDLVLAAHLSFTAELKKGRIQDYSPDNDHEQEYLKTVQRYADDKPKGERAADLFAEATGALYQGIQDGGEDPLGDVYMAAISFGEHGQFFTPYHVATMMAQMQMSDVVDGQTVLDPTCGAGVMLIAAAEVNPRAKFYGIDLDDRCAKMAALNLMLRKLTGSVWCGNSLTGEMYTRWDFSGGMITREDKPGRFEYGKKEEPQQLTLL